jgi:hypothetical protein
MNLGLPFLSGGGNPFYFKHKRGGKYEKEQFTFFGNIVIAFD